jgi:hypothetical protein
VSSLARLCLLGSVCSSSRLCLLWLGSVCSVFLALTSRRDLCGSSVFSALSALSPIRLCLLGSISSVLSPRFNVADWRLYIFLAFFPLGPVRLLGSVFSALSQSSRLQLLGSGFSALSSRLCLLGSVFSALSSRLSSWLCLLSSEIVGQSAGTCASSSDNRSPERIKFRVIRVGVGVLCVGVRLWCKVRMGKNTKEHGRM